MVDKKKQQVKNENPFLGKPTQDVEHNISVGIDDEIPDPDDVPGGLESNLQQNISQRPDLEQADNEARQESEE